MTRLQAPAFAPTLTPAGEAVQAGPWRLTLTDRQVGDNAYNTIAGFNSGNDEAPAGASWVLAWFVAENTSDRPLVINLTDFAATGTDGIMRRTPAMEAPEPALQATIEPGASAEGWVPSIVNDPASVIYWFSSPFLGGNWAEAWFAVTDGAQLPAFDPPAEDSGLGTAPDSPATFGQTVRAGDFDVSIEEHIQGQAVYDIAEFGLRALAASSGFDNWHALRVRATNISNRPAFFSYSALRLSAASGEPWDHVLLLTPPVPDVAKEILPGATREGWAAFQEMPWSPLELMRVEPSVVTDEPRFITFGGSAPPATQAEPEEPAPTFAAGDQATLTEDLVNLRTDASTSGEIVTELSVGTQLVITGDAVEADGYTWYPVEAVDGGEAGYVVVDYLAPAMNE